MSLSDCIKCWDTPCSCGWEYRNYPKQDLEDKTELYKLILKYKTDNPDAKFSDGWGDKTETEDDKALMVILNDFHRACYERDK